MELTDLFNAGKPVIGMLHVPALPGSPRNTLGFNAIIDWVLRDADALVRGGVDGLIIENFGDVPFYPRQAPPHTIAFMTRLGHEVGRSYSQPLGINILRNDARSALAVASAVAAKFIRVNIHTGARLTDQGLIEGEAHQTLRYRKLLSSDVKIFADVDVKHSAPVAPHDLSDEVEETIARGCADVIIISGRATGRQTAIEDLKLAKAAGGQTPVFVGSGIGEASVREVLRLADGLIVGTAFKKDGVSTNPVDIDRVRSFVAAVRENVSRTQEAQDRHEKHKG
jgi:membrane complex biogenesis BtpA family protein